MSNLVVSCENFDIFVCKTGSLKIFTAFVFEAVIFTVEVFHVFIKFIMKTEFLLV